MGSISLCDSAIQMTIIRNKRINNFTTIQNSLINDQRLGWHDLGMLVYLLSKPDTWKVRVDVLVKERNLGKNAVYEILKRLREYGYARLVKFADGSTEWYIYDNPNLQNPDQENRDQADPNPENPDQANPDQANPDQGFRDVLVKTDVKKRLISSKERLIVTTEEKKSRNTDLDDLLSDVTQQTKSDFKKLRSAKKSPITQRAIEGIRREAQKAGITLENALIECCERGWVGFKAEWYINSTMQQARASPKPINKAEALLQNNLNVARNWKPPELRSENE